MQYNYKKITNRIVFALLALAVILSILTYTVITQVKASFDQDSYIIIFLLSFDFILICSLVTFIAKKLFNVWKKRKLESGGSRLQGRILLMFSLLSAVPAILIAMFSALFFRYVIDSWFNKNVDRVLNESVVVAESYLKEHQEFIKIRAKAVATEIDNNIIKYDLTANKRLFTDIITQLTDLNALSEAAIFYNHEPVIRSRLGISLSLETFPEEYYQQARIGEIVVIKDLPNKIRAMIMLHSLPNSFLVIGKYVDNNVVDHIAKSQVAAEQYKNLKNQIVRTQLRFALGFLVISVLVLLVAIYIGILFASTIVNPILRLVSATKKVQIGDFSTKVEEGPENDEIANLSRAFNLMTERISGQQAELLQAQRYVAWSDVARRIAHEVKNPLTPIRLGAERLSSKYAHQVDNPEAFNKYVNTIIKHINDIGRIIEEFSQFARMPAPIINEVNLTDAIREIIFLRQSIVVKIKYILELEENVMVLCDQTQLHQLLINIIKNAEESIEATNKFEQDAGIIEIALHKDKNYATIVVKDNGQGFDSGIIEKVTDPYFTTKTKGSGIGLAIVKKIVDDHSGKLIIQNDDKNYAIVTVLLPLVLKPHTQKENN